MSFDTQAARSLTGSVFGSLQKARLDTVLVAACAEIDRLQAALSFYADPMTYEESAPLSGLLDGVVPIREDQGERARVALGSGELDRSPSTESKPASSQEQT